MFRKAPDHVGRIVEIESLVLGKEVVVVMNVDTERDVLGVLSV